MIEAEARLRGQHPSGGGALVAEANVNALLDNDDQGPAGNPMIHEVEPELESHVEAFATVNFGDEPLFGDLVDLARARAAGIWLTGARQGYLRRLASEFGDRTVGGLFPDRSDVNSISLPVPNDEIDNNQNISSVCPSGLP